MRQPILFAFILAISLPSIVAGDQTVDGFNGYPWGTSYKSMDSLSLGVPDSIPAGGDDSVGLSRYTSGVTAVGNCPVETVTLSFLDGELSSVTILGEGPDAFRCLYGMMETNWGKPERVSVEYEMYRFTTDRTEASLTFAEGKVVFATLHEATMSEFKRFAKRRAKQTR